MRASLRLLTTLFLGSCLAYGCLGSGDETEESDDVSGVTQSLGLVGRGALQEPAPAPVKIPPGLLEEPASGSGGLHGSPFELPLTVRTFTGYAWSLCEDVAVPDGTWRAFYPFPSSMTYCAWTWTSPNSLLPMQSHLAQLEQGRRTALLQTWPAAASHTKLEAEPSCNYPSCMPQASLVESLAQSALECSCPVGGDIIINGVGGCSVCAGDVAGDVLHLKAYLRVTDKMQRDSQGRVTLVRPARDGSVHTVGKVFVPDGATLIEADIEEAEALEDGQVYVQLLR